VRGEFVGDAAHDAAYGSYGAATYGSYGKRHLLTGAVTNGGYGGYGAPRRSLAAACAKCPPGKFAPPVSGGESSPPCALCAVGKHQPDHGQLACRDCEVGRFASFERQGLHGAAHCDDCPAGQFAPRPASVNCSACVAGQSQHEPGQERCDVCPRGQSQRQRGKAECNLCTAATYMDEEGGTGCKPCYLLDEGARPITYGNGATNASKCVAPLEANAVCPVGQASTTRDSSSCADCTAGRFKAARDELPCTRCDCGRFSRPGATACDAACDAGEFGNSTSGTCEPCPADHFCISSQMYPFAEARECAPGAHIEVDVSSAEDRTCAPCAVGRFSNASNTAGGCTACPVGKFQPKEGTSFCETCDEGYFCPADRATGLTEKKECPGGMRCWGANTEPCENKVSDVTIGKCVSCPDLQYASVRDNKCVGCPLKRGGKDGDAPLLLELLDGIECASGAVAVKPDYYVVTAKPGEAAPLGPGTSVVRCRSLGVCATNVSTSAASATTLCLGNTRGPLCGACRAGYARRSPQGACDRCPGRNGAGPLLLLAGALVVFGVLYRQCIKFALRNARQGYKNKVGARGEDGAIDRSRALSLAHSLACSLALGLPRRCLPTGKLTPPPLPPPPSFSFSFLLCLRRAGSS
jgi:hypothetical protein